MFYGLGLRVYGLGFMVYNLVFSFHVCGLGFKL